MKAIHNKFTLMEAIIIVFFWVILLISPLLFGQFEDEIDWNQVFIVWKNNIPLLLLFALNRFWLVPYILLKNKRLSYFVLVLGSIFIINLGTFLWFTHSQPNEPLPYRLEQGPPPDFHSNPPPPASMENPNFRRNTRRPPVPTPNRIPAYMNLLILSILVIGFDTGLRTSFELSKTEQEKAQLSKEKVESQLAFLRNQISPHFFMNTLNNIHALVDINTEEAKTAIIKLSQLMDYMLYETEAPEVPLSKEIELISSFVDLMRLRYTDEVKIQFDAPATIPPISIPPLLTISFIENAFKYGVSYEAESFIHIKIESEEKSLFFKIQNSKHEGKEIRKNSGIGIQNTQNRLSLIYGTQFELNLIDSDPNLFEVNLKIPIS